MPSLQDAENAAVARKPTKKKKLRVPATKAKPPEPKRPKAGPLSLYPLTFDEALGAIIRCPKKKG